MNWYSGPILLDLFTQISREQNIDSEGKIALPLNFFIFPLKEVQCKRFIKSKLFL